MRGAASAIVTLIVFGGILGYLLMYRVGYEQPSVGDPANEQSPAEPPAGEPGLLAGQAGGGTGGAGALGSPLPAAPANQQPSGDPVESGLAQCQQERDSERLRRLSLEGALQPLPGLQADLDEKIAQLDEMMSQLFEKIQQYVDSSALAESQRAAAAAQELVLQREREQVRRERERLVALQIFTLVALDLILVVEILRLWHRRRPGNPQARVTAAAAQPGLLARQEGGAA